MVSVVALFGAPLPRFCSPSSLRPGGIPSALLPTNIPTTASGLVANCPARSFSPFPSSAGKPLSSVKDKQQKAEEDRPQQPYVYPDPIPGFAEAETQRFERGLLTSFSTDKDTFGPDVDAVVRVCSEGYFFGNSERNIKSKHQVALRPFPYH